MTKHSFTEMLLLFEKLYDNLQDVLRMLPSEKHEEKKKDFLAVWHQSLIECGWQIAEFENELDSRTCR